jgi:hypothetical protein
MAELVFFHGPGKPDGRFTVQIVYDADRPKLEQYAGRVVDLHGAKVFQSVWCSGNGAAIDHAERWCASAQAKEHTHAPSEASPSSQPAAVQAPPSVHADGGAGPAHDDTEHDA